MHDEAEKRLKALIDTPRAPTTDSGRIWAMKPLIDELRVKGHPWAAICEALGVSRSSLFSALKRGPRSTRSRAADVDGGGGAE